MVNILGVTKERSGIIALLIIFCSLSLLIGISFPFLKLYTTEYDLNGISCEGIEKYYTGRGFYSDVLNSGANEGYQENDPGIFLTPSELGDYGWDCEDISHFIMCLADIYDIECNYYYQANYGRVEDGNHVGIECLVEGEWEVLY